MNSLIHRSTVLGFAGIASLLFAAPARAQSDAAAVVAAVTSLLSGIHSRDTSLMRSAVASGATLVPVGGPAPAAGPTTLDDIIQRSGKGTGPGNDERIGPATVQIDGPLAAVWAYYTLTHPGESRIDHCGVNAFLLRKGPDGWRIFQIAATSRTDGCAAVGM